MREIEKSRHTQRVRMMVCELIILSFVVVLVVKLYDCYIVV